MLEMPFAPASESLAGRREQLLHQLLGLRTTERERADDLLRQFRQAGSMSARLLLSDQRRDSNRQLIRLERLIQVTLWIMQAPGGTARFPRSRADSASADDRAGAPARPMAAGEVNESEAALAAYASAIALARRLDQHGTVNLLTVSLEDKRATVMALSRRSTGNA